MIVSFTTLFGAFELEDVASLRLPAVDGELGVLDGHCPLIAALDCGVVTVRYPDGKLERAAIGEGFARVGPDQTRLTVTFSDRAREIDIERAHGALTRAVGRMQARYEEFDMKRAEAALCRAVARLQACGCGCSLCQTATLP